MNWKAYFSEDDKSKMVKFLNLVAKHAQWNLSTEEMIDVYKHLQFMQQTILPKMENNILEIKQIIENKERAQQKEPSIAEQLEAPKSGE